ncbi:MAG: hypothetical protein WCO78_05690 [Candidatus Roizmanbacteria bacterium]
MSAPHTVFLSGPPGVGKTACIDTLCGVSAFLESGHFIIPSSPNGLNGLSEFVNVPQVTTRPQRVSVINSGEIDGKRHISVDEFQTLQSNGIIRAGWRNPNGYYYGFDVRDLTTVSQRMEPHQTLLLEVNPLNPNLSQITNDQAHIKNCGWIGFTASDSYTLAQTIARKEGVPGSTYHDVHSFLQIPKIQDILVSIGYRTQPSSTEDAYRLLSDLARIDDYNIDAFKSKYDAYINRMKELKESGQMHRFIEFSWGYRGHVFDIVANTVESLVRHPRTPEGGITHQQRVDGDREAVLTAKGNWYRKRKYEGRVRSEPHHSEGGKAIIRIQKNEIANEQAMNDWRSLQGVGVEGSRPSRWSRR